MIFIRRSVLTTLSLLGILSVIYFMTSSSSSAIEQSISNISNVSKEDLLKFTKQDASTPSPPDLKKDDNVVPAKNEEGEPQQVEFTETPFMPKMANETLKAQLGNASWRLFHTILARYPDKPSVQERNTLENYIQLFAQVYPCGDCARHFQKLLQKYPPQTGSRKTAALWGCHVHNIVNEKLHKSEYDCTTILEDYDCGCGDDEKESDYTLKGESMDHLRLIKMDEKKDIQKGG
ncbi:FAD-linked sulfhydryl oxidase ERV2 [Candida viswanathii]|uniref:Sulfhydryl oxidase n=1 Tax=Candida viswanathii TaxID=5486 RepID=A0A367YII8_9ASCO|nr:FAD-linked sulfhydryl oxidase ERV2 [Candida viswanathii]